MFYNDPAIDDVEWYGTFQITINRRPIVLRMGEDTITAPEGKIWTFGANTAIDPEGLAITKTLYVDGSTTIPAWLVYDLDYFEFRVVTSTNAIAGLHNITVEIDDSFSIPKSTSFILEIKEADGPGHTKFIENISILYHHTKVYH